VGYDAEDRQTCERCGDYIDENEGSTVYTGRYEQTWCADCANDYTTYIEGAGHFTDAGLEYRGLQQCEHCEEWTTGGLSDVVVEGQRHPRRCCESCTADAIWIDAASSHFATEDAAREAGYEQCYDCGTWEKEDDLVEVIGDDDKYCTACMERNKHAFYQAPNGAWFDSLETAVEEKAVPPGYATFTFYPVPAPAIRRPIHNHTAGF
jgi:hypothetical protein